MNAAILGAGAMGKTLMEYIKESEGIDCIGMIEPLTGGSLMQFDGLADVIIDFSNPGNLSMMEEYVKEHPCALVIATTGYTSEQVSRIEELARRVPVVYTANMSLGVTVMKMLAAQLFQMLGDTFDVEVIEKHHNKKLDSPSGTAKMLVDAMDPEEKMPRVYGRLGNQKRSREIGVHAVRGGTIAGEHTIIFAGTDEIIELTHSAASKKVFAAGAVRAAKYVAGKPAGLYDMSHVLGIRKEATPE